MIQSVRDTQIMHVPREWPWAEQERDRIKAHWAQRLARSPALFDGRVMLACDLALKDGVLHGRCFETDFSKFTAWRDFGWPDTHVFNVFAPAALRAEDGAYLLGVMGAHTVSAGHVYFPCGTPDPHDLRDGMLDLAGSVTRELFEETGLALADVRLGEGFTLVQHGQFVAVFRDVFVPGTADAVRERVRATLAAQDDPELEDLFIVRGPSDLDPARMPSFTLAFLQSRFA